MSAQRRWQRPSYRAISPRPGHTLVEIVLVATCLSLLMTLATRLIVLMYDRERASSEQVQAATGIDRLAHQFQRDVRAAEKNLHIAPGSAVSEVVPPLRTPGRATPVMVRLQTGNTVVEYAETTAGVTRNVLRGDAREQHDLFRLPTLAGQVARDLPRAHVTMQEMWGKHQILTLTIDDLVGEGITNGSISRPRSPPGLNVQAVLGADLRFAGERAKEER